MVLLSLVGAFFFGIDLKETRDAVSETLEDARQALEETKQTAEEAEKAQEDLELSLTHAQEKIEEGVNTANKLLSTAKDAQKEIANSVRSVREKERNAEVAIDTQVMKAGRYNKSTYNTAQDRVRPISPGLSVGTQNGKIGTICCLVRDDEGSTFALTVPYVIANKWDDIGKNILQPAGKDGGSDINDVIGEVAKVTWKALKIKLDESIETSNEIPDIGAVLGSARPRINQRVRMYGRTSELSFGTIVGRTSNRFELGAGFGGAVSIKGYEVRSKSEVYADEGDEGAPVVNREGFLIGMHYADGIDKKNVGFFVPITAILKELRVTLITSN